MFLAEADVLKYQQQVMLENILYSSGGSNNNNNNDSLASPDNISSLSNVDGLIYRNHTANCNGLVERNDNPRKQFLVVNYEFSRTEPLSAETAVIVTRYIAPQKGFCKNLASEERSFNISISLPNAAMECDFMWGVTNCETIELRLKSSFQTADFVIQNFLTQQIEKAHLLLRVKKLTAENVSFAICQPWEEILLLKKPKSAFVWDSEFCRIQKARVEISTKSSNENGCSKNELMENIAMGDVVDVAGGDDTHSSIIQANPTCQMSETVTSEQNEEIVSYKDEKEEESRIPQEITYKEKEIDVGIAVRDDDKKFKQQISGEYPEISISVLAAIQRYVDDLLDFRLDIPIAISTDATSYKQNDVNRSNTTSNQMENSHFDYSFCRKSEHIETIRDLPVLGLTSASSHLIKNLSPPGVTCLNSNPGSKNMVSNKKSIESTIAIRPLPCEIDYNSDEDSRQDIDNPGSKESCNKLDTCSSFNALDMQSNSHLLTETYPLCSSMESTDAAATFDASEEFEVFNVSADSRLQRDESYSTSVRGSECNLHVLNVDHTKPSLVNPGIVDSSTSNSIISAKELPSVHGSITDELLSRIRVIDEGGREIETEIKIKSEENEEALQIERAIYDISERIEHQQSLTEAQAEASEELLKTILENIIKNIGQSSVVETMAAYKKPVVLLREKLTDLEETLKREDLECKESSMRLITETQPTFSKSFSAEGEYAKSVRESSIEGEIGASFCDFQQIESINNQEIRRMTPLTSNIKEQLQSLECMLEEVEKEGEDDMKESTAEIQAAFPVYSDAKQHEVHNILMQINNEISIIKQCCQRNISKTSVDAAVGLLQKVRNNVSSMIDLISLYRKRLRKKSPAEKGLNINKGRMKSSKRPHHLSPCSRTGFFFKTDASVNFYFMKREESEIINAIVKLFSSSDKSGNQMFKSVNSEISTYEDAVFDDKNKTLQGSGTNPLRTSVSELATEKDDKVIFSSLIDPQSSSFSLYSVQDSQTAPIRPPRRPRKMIQQRTSSPIPPLRMKRLSKSCDDYKNLIVRSRSSSTPNCPLPIQQNMKTILREEDEASQLDAVVYADDRLDPLNIMNLVDVEESSALMPRQKSKKLNEKDISYERIIRKEESFYSCSYVWPFKEQYRISLEMFDESSSVQLICEDSDYAPEPVLHSLLLFEPTNRVQEETNEMLLQTLAFLSDLNTSKVGTITGNTTKLKENFAGLKDEKGEKESITPEFDERYNQNNSSQKINENSKLIENSKSSTSEDVDFETTQNYSKQNFHVSLGTKPRESSITNPVEDEANSLHEIESIDDKDEILDDLDDLMVICNPHASVIDGFDLLPTIMEDSESSKIANSFMSLSTNTVIAVGIPKTNVQEANKDIQKIVVDDEEESDTTESSTLELRSGLPGKSVKVPVMNDDVNYLNNYKKRVILVSENDAEQVSEEATISVNYKRSSNKLKIIAVLSPEVQAKVEACIGEGFDVLVEQPDEAQDFTIKILDHVNDSISLDLTIPSTIEVDLSLRRNEQCEGILSYQVENLINNKIDEEQISVTSDYEHHHHSSEDKEQRTGISVNIIARSMHDVARASLEEIPWGEVSMYIVMRPIMTHSITDSETKNSLIQNVTVSESNETERHSLRSHESFRSSSHQSFDWTDFGDRSGSGQNLNIPTYVVREGSTATITCEFNNFLTPGSLIDWFKGKALMQIVPGKTDRISHDLLEVLVISHVNLMDGDIYSIKVNDVIYPVACLIVENADISAEKINDDVHFISPPQTLFVMEGQPSIISCQVNRADQKIEWCKDNKKWITENERVRLEADQFGYHRIIIDKSELEDQGTYYAFLGDHFTTVTLVVEGKHS